MELEIREYSRVIYTLEIDALDIENKIIFVYDWEVVDGMIDEARLSGGLNMWVGDTEVTGNDIQ